MKQDNSIKNILKKLLMLDGKSDWLRKDDLRASSSHVLIRIVKSQKILLETVKVNSQSEEQTLYRLKDTANNIKRAMSLLEILP